jgi:hypothetical protein
MLVYGQEGAALGQVVDAVEFEFDAYITGFGDLPIGKSYVYCPPATEGLRM